jgi:hypothetical protein
MGQAILLLQRLRTICRRAVILSDISRADFRRLPMELKPTFLLNQPDVSAKLLRFWHASNFRILRVPGNGGALQSVACSKAVFVGMDGGSDSWSQQAVHLPLPPKHRRVQPLEPRKEAKVTEYLREKRFDQTPEPIRNKFGSHEKSPDQEEFH